MRKFSSSLYTLLWVALFLIPMPTAAIEGQDQSITPELSEQVVNQIRLKTIPLYKKYSGIEYTENAIRKTYDGKTGSLMNTVEIKRMRRKHFYQDAEITAIRYEVDGKEQSPSEYKPSDSPEPEYPVFDEKGAEHYDVNVVGYKMIEGQKCYQLEIRPKTDTPKHLKGYMYFTTDSLELVFFEGSPANLPFGVKKMTGRMHYAALDGMPVETHGSLEVIARVPLIVNQKIIIETQCSNQKLISR